MIPYGHQTIEPDDVEAVVAALTSDWLTQGPRVREFEAAIEAVTGARHAVVFANGTLALHAACSAAGLGPGDRVVTPTLSFVASANCARYVGADVELADIDSATLNLDVEAAPAGDALVAVHFAGLPLDLRELRERYPVVIEDAAHALGARTPYGPVGSCTMSDLCCFSFHPVKAITTGEGGAVTTNSEELADRLRAFRNHGLVRPDPNHWHQEARSVGVNGRMTDLQAALGLSQLAKLDRFIERRSAIAARYEERFANTPVRSAPRPPNGFSHAYHLFPVRIPDRDRVFHAMRDAGIGVQVHYLPIHRHPTYRETTRPCPAADAAYEELLSIPIYPTLGLDEQDRVADVLLRLL